MSKLKLHSRGIVTLKDWCEKNGYDGVTKECVISASNSPDEEVQEMAKQHKLKSIAGGSDGKGKGKREKVYFGR